MGDPGIIIPFTLSDLWTLEYEGFDLANECGSVEISFYNENDLLDDGECDINTPEVQGPCPLDSLVFEAFPTEFEVSQQNEPITIGMYTVYYELLLSSYPPI